MHAFYINTTTSNGSNGELLDFIKIFVSSEFESAYPILKQEITLLQKLFLLRIIEIYFIYL